MQRIAVAAASRSAASRASASLRCSLPTSLERAGRAFSTGAEDNAARERQQGSTAEESSSSRCEGCSIKGVGCEGCRQAQVLRGAVGGSRRFNEVPHVQSVLNLNVLRITDLPPPGVSRRAAIRGGLAGTAWRPCTRPPQASTLRWTPLRCPRRWPSFTRTRT